MFFLVGLSITVTMVTPRWYNGTAGWTSGFGECQWLMSNYHIMKNRQDEQLAEIREMTEGSLSLRIESDPAEPSLVRRRWYIQR